MKIEMVCPFGVSVCLQYVSSIVVNASNPSSPSENGIDSNENSSSAMDQAMAATLAAIEIPEPITKNGI